MTGLALFVSTFAYAGYSPVAPGTAGSAAALVVYAALRYFGLMAFEPGLIIGLFLIGIWTSSATAAHLHRSDPGIVVIDEVVGMLITVAYLNVTVPGAVIGFLLFRVFDIIKPFPAAQSERLPGGVGIMMDDVFAGLYAHLILRGLASLIPGAIVRP